MCERLQPGEATEIDLYRGHPYSWDGVNRVARWMFSAELTPSYSGTIRVIVIIADHGSEIWACVQAMATLFYFRVLYLPDPLHAWSLVFANGVRRFKVYTKVALAMVTVSKYMRAPFGSGKMWSAVLRSITFLLENYSMKDPMLE